MEFKVPYDEPYTLACSLARQAHYAMWTGIWSGASRLHIGNNNPKASWANEMTLQNLAGTYTVLQNMATGLDLIRTAPL